MAEAAAALALVSNVFQMLDYGRQFATAAHKIWESGQEGIQGFTTLQILCKDLDNTLRDLETTTSSSHSSSVSKNDSAIAALAIECTKLTRRILDSLPQVGLTGSGRKRDAAKAAFRVLWNKNEIKALESQLDKLQKQMMLRLHVSGRYD